MLKVESWMVKRAGQSNNCTLENAAVRREWYVKSKSLTHRRVALTTNRSDLSAEERKEYISAVLCLQSKPAKAPKDKVPGALSRFDDFVATHMTMAGMLHSPNNLFAAHRYFIHAYEKALREECGYKGYQPVSTFR
jgi:tyrosinase